MSYEVPCPGINIYSGQGSFVCTAQSLSVLRRSLATNITKFQYYLAVIRTNENCTGRPGSSEVPRNPLTRWDVSSIPANGIFLTKKLKTKTKNAQRVEND